MAYLHLNSSVFPFVNYLGNFKTSVGEKEEIRYQDGEPGFTTAVYMVSMESTFDNPYARECRGIVFDSEGHVVARPLHKFFNLNERPDTQLANLPWDKIHRVMDKRDGSMIHTVDVGNVRGSPFGPQKTFDLKSKKSFKSDVANEARAYMLRPENKNYIEFCQRLVNEGKTAIFEWTSPTSRIVLPYQSDGLHLLHIRDNDTGAYESARSLNTFCIDYGIQQVYDVALPSDDVPVTSNFIYTTKTGRPIEYTLTKDRPLIDQFLELAETLPDTEGWIFQFANGEMVKLKTKEYIKKHRTMTFLRVRDIAEMVLDEKIDDIKGMLVGEGINISEILEIERDVVGEFDAMIRLNEKTYEQVKHLTKKEVAIKYGPSGFKMSPAYFGLLMKKMDGKEPDYKEFFRKNSLPHYDLRQLNLLQSNAEAE